MNRSNHEGKTNMTPELARYNQLIRTAAAMDLMRIAGCGIARIEEVFSDVYDGRRSFEQACDLLGIDHEHCDLVRELVDG